MITRKIVGITILIVCALLPLIVFYICGCSGEKASEKSRFMKVEGNLNWWIFADRETGVMYAVSCGAHNSGNFTLLVDANENPLIYEGDMND